MRLRAARISLASFLLVVAITVAACSGDGTAEPTGSPDTLTGTASSPGVSEPRRGGTLTYALPADPQSCDLHMSGGMGYASVHPCNTMLSQLIRFSPSDHSLLEPDLATEWAVSADGRTWTFNLRDGVTWHDGSEFTSDDVLFSLERVLDPPEGLAVGQIGRAHV